MINVERGVHFLATEKFAPQHFARDLCEDKTEQTDEENSGELIYLNAQADSWFKLAKRRSTYEKDLVAK